MYGSTPEGVAASEARLREQLPAIQRPVRGDLVLVEGDPITAVDFVHIGELELEEGGAGPFLGGSTWAGGRTPAALPRSSHMR